MRFIKKVGKLAKFVIPLQDAHEGGSAALASGLWPELKLSLLELKPGSIDIYILIKI